MPHFLSVSLNPTFQRTIRLDSFENGEVNRALEARLDASGKGINVCRVLQQLGDSAKQLTHLGPGKKKFLDLCTLDRLELVGIDCPSPIRTCITLLDHQTHSTTEIIEPTEPVASQTASNVCEAFTREIADADWIILSGSKAPGYPANLFAHFCKEAHEAGVPVLADYRGSELLASLPYLPRLVKINLVEFATTFLPELKVSEADDSSSLKAVQEKLKELSFCGINYVITRGFRDVFFAENGRVESITPPKIVPVNTIGSGDSVAAGMAFALARKANLKEATMEGVRCGAINARHLKPGSLE